MIKVWLTNFHIDERPEVYGYKRIGVGAPRATAEYTVNELWAMGMRGLYGYTE